MCCDRQIGKICAEAETPLQGKLTPREIKFRDVQIFVILLYFTVSVPSVRVQSLQVY